MLLTAETLRTDFLDLWVEHQLPTKSVLLVTHNIEEAVMVCDRILVLSSNPGRIAAEIPVPLAHPRNRLDQEFHDLVDEFYSILTSRVAESIKAQGQIHGGLVQTLPAVGFHLMSAVVEAVARPPNDGQADLADIARLPDLGAKDLFAVAEALHILEFAELKDGAIKLTAASAFLRNVRPRSASESSRNICCALCLSRHTSGVSSMNARATRRHESGSNRNSKII